MFDWLKFAVSEEMVVAWVRTAMGFVYAWLLKVGMTEFPDFVGWSWVPAEFPQNSAFVLVLGTAIYGLIRIVAEKFPSVGAFLIFNKKPRYAGVPASADAVDPAAIGA